jgi:membrane protease subunit (stomatin/prohibitin family)
MPLMRRRPLLRAAMVGGAGYAAGKHMQRKSEHEAEQDAQIQATQQQPPPAQQAAAPPPAAPPSQEMNEAERIDALKKLKDLLDSGVLTQEQFDAEKAKLLPGS